MRMVLFDNDIPQINKDTKDTGIICSAPTFLAAVGALYIIPCLQISRLAGYPYAPSALVTARVMASLTTSAANTPTRS